jgi:hypothetical protein
MSSITSANSQLLLGVIGLYQVPQKLAGFGADDAYSMDAVETAEVVMGVDGIMSAGYVPQIKVMHVVLQADSDSNGFFEAWYAAQEAANEIYKAFGTIVQKSVGRTYVLTNGVLTNYAPIADAGKVLKPRKFQIKWNVVVGAPI